MTAETVSRVEQSASQRAVDSPETSDLDQKGSDDGTKL
jgi:hypothetical protein